MTREQAVKKAQLVYKVIQAGALPANELVLKNLIEKYEISESELIEVNVKDYDLLFNFCQQFKKQDTFTKEETEMFFNFFDSHPELIPNTNLKVLYGTMRHLFKFKKFFS